MNWVVVDISEGSSGIVKVEVCRSGRVDFTTENISVIVLPFMNFSLFFFTIGIE
jgi:hypothetical protein